MPTMATPLATLLANEMEAREWSQRDLAERAGFKNHVTIGHILRGTTKTPDLATLGKLASALATTTVTTSMYFERLLRAAGYSIGDARPDEVLARIDSVLSEHQREQLRHLSDEQLLDAINLILKLAGPPRGAPPK